MSGFLHRSLIALQASGSFSGSRHCAGSMARRRGPPRKPGSSQKQRCAYRLCRSRRDVKNSKWCLPVRQVSSSSTRKLHCKAKTARFCCEEHRTKAKSTGAVAKKPYGQRESLTQQQVTYLFDIMLHKVGCAWAAVMLLLSVSTGERVDAVRQVCTTWLTGLDDQAVGKPTISWPRVNLKTTARDSILDSGVAQLLWQWISRQPLKTTQGSQWPFAGQDVQHHLAKGTPCYLFPGRMLGGKDCRNSEQAVTARAYNYVWKSCQHILKAEITAACKQGRSHPFTDVDLRRLSSHCGKKSCVNLLQEQGNPVSIASALTCTTPSVLQNSYIAKPKPAAQRSAVHGAMQEVVSGVQLALDPIFCTTCGLKGNAEWVFCPKCGQRMRSG